MLGVVIWSNPQERKAVIWCEDHGDLAYFSGETSVFGDIGLDAGDLVDFEMTTERDLRRAHNPRLVTEDAYQGLDEQLRANNTRLASDHKIKQDSRAETGPIINSAQIIPLSRGIARRKSARAESKQAG